MTTKLIDIRDHLYDKLPTGNVDAHQLMVIIKNHLKELDDYIDNIDREDPTYPKAFVEHCFKITSKNALDEFYKIWLKHSKDLSCPLKSGDE
jgi:hypothetical protein